MKMYMMMKIEQKLTITVEKTRKQKIKHLI